MVDEEIERQDKEHDLKMKNLIDSLVREWQLTLGTNEDNSVKYEKLKYLDCQNTNCKVNNLGIKISCLEAYQIRKHMNEMIIE